MVDPSLDEASLLTAIHLSPIAAVVSDPRLPHNPIVAANAAFCTLTGYGEGEIVGRNCRFLAGEGTEPWLSEQIASAIARRRPVRVDILNYKRDRTPFRNAVLIAPVFWPDGELRYFVSSQMEATDADAGGAAARRLGAARLVDALSPRQRQVLQRIAAGRRTKQIAFELGLSERTVKMHRALLLTRLGKTNVADAVRVAVEAGL